MLVFVAHAGWEYVVPGGFGVTVFFFLSGYLITTLLRRELDLTGGISLRKFYLRRAYRIFPPLYIVLLLILILALAGIIEHRMRLDAVISQVFFWTNYYNISHGGQYFVPTTGVYWSLAVEEHFYFVFPLLFVAVMRRASYQRAALSFLVLSILALVWRSWLVLEEGMPHLYTYSATDTRFDSLLFGCILGVWRNPVADAELSISERARVFILVLALGVLLSTFLFRNEQFRETLRYTLQGVALVPIFWLAIRHHDWPVFRWLNWPPVRFFGVVSFTFYLFHGMALGFASHLLDDRVPRALLGFAFSLSFATAMYFLVERPIASLRKRLHPECS